MKTQSVEDIVLLNRYVAKVTDDAGGLASWIRTHKWSEGIVFVNEEATKRDTADLESGFYGTKAGLETALIDLIDSEFKGWAFTMLTQDISAIPGDDVPFPPSKEISASQVRYLVNSCYPGSRGDIVSNLRSVLGFYFVSLILEVETPEVEAAIMREDVDGIFSMGGRVILPVYDRQSILVLKY